MVFADCLGPAITGTQGGRIFLGADSLGEKMSGFIQWESGKAKRACRSSTTGEVLSASEALDGAI